jgi:hypothetical protein
MLRRLIAKVRTQQLPGSLLAALLWLSACSSNAALQITANVDAELIRVGGLDGAKQSVGKLPQSVTAHPGMDFFVVENSGYLPMHVLLPVADDLSGAIRLNLLPLAKLPVAPSEGARDDQLLDRLLHAHRALLRGQLAQAKEQLQALEREGGGSFYGMLMLRADIAYLEGQYDDAAADYQRAKALLPNGVPQ